MQWLQRISVGLAVALGACALAASASAAKAPPAAPPTLSTTSFAGTPTITSSNCNPGGNSTFSYHIAGGSFGTYSGTFEESGVVVVGPQPLGNPSEQAQLVSLTAAFTIDSAVGQVSGTKSLVTPSPLAYGACLDLITLPTLGTATIHFATAGQLQYTATIRANGGVWRDEGTSNLGSVQQTVSTAFGTQGGFSEGFLSTLLEPVFLGFEKNGRGCGDDNHVHERRAECPPQSQK